MSIEQKLDKFLRIDEAPGGLRKMPKNLAMKKYKAMQKQGTRIPEIERKYLLDKLRKKMDEHHDDMDLIMSFAALLMFNAGFRDMEDKETYEIGMKLMNGEIEQSLDPKTKRALEPMVKFIDKLMLIGDTLAELESIVAEQR